MIYALQQAVELITYLIRYVIRYVIRYANVPKKTQELMLIRYLNPTYLWCFSPDPFYVLLINNIKTMKNVLVVIKVHFIGMCVVFGEFKLLRDYATFIFTFISRFLLGLNKHFDCLNNL